MKSNSTQTENMNNTEIAIRFVIAIGIVWLMYNVTLFAN